ncbi:polysialyltransferase family glycosyltransferase [Asticcacaulis machinosus]|uniref:Polysialyltransferase family glycosyltransferase n=1 Tax=Asticcacaulis machinosus TaxID=2984211 RepID=A0ABT5HJM0_9CAUL|nr:polysialyltransferase family glycosyltransferase [Asticcacaulis machinosus]MDC7676441.1 polysialyltransferase family glycosyltransferase [Asticcacaulis machinosus]
MAIGTYDNIFLINSPVQYLMARAIVQQYLPGRHLAILYKEGGNYEGIFEQMDALMGPSPFDYMDFEAAMTADFKPAKRLFLSFRFSSFVVRAYYKIKAEAVCVFEDGLALYTDHAFYDKSLNDRNVHYRIRDGLKRLLRHTGIRPNALPHFLRFDVFDEIYSVFPWVPDARRDAKMLPIEGGFREVLKARPSGGAGECLFLSQALVASHMMEKDAYTRLINTIIDALSRKYERIWVKPHPRDEADVRAFFDSHPKCEALPKAYSRVPAEIYISQNPQTEVYGFTTSTQSYVAKLFGTPTFSLAPFAMDWPGSYPTLRDFWEPGLPLMERSGIKLLSDL